MPRPTAVRVGLWLVGLTLLASFVSYLWPRRHMSGGIGQAATLLLIYGSLLYATARRRNWARLTFTFLYIVSAILSLAMLGRFGPADTAAIILTVGWITVQGAGLACLFLPSAAAWYHASDRSSLTSA